MSKEENVFSTTLRLNLDHTQDLAAWNCLMSADTRQPEYSSYSKTIITAINDHFSRAEQSEQNDREGTLLKKIEETIRQSIRNNLKEIPVLTPVDNNVKSDLRKAYKSPKDYEEIINGFLEYF